MSKANRSVPPTAAEIGLGRGLLVPPDKRTNSRNWTLAPYNRWSFQRVQQFTRTARVPRSERPSVLQVAPRDLAEIRFEDCAGDQCSIADLLARSYTDGFLILHRGRIVTEQYFNGMGPSSLHLIMSCSKSMTSTVAGIYIENGTLNPSSLLTAYLPELAKTGMAGATLQQALDMQVGVKFSEDYDDLEADWRACEVATGWRDAPVGYSGPLDQISYAQTLTEQEADHGTRFHYQSIVTNMIGCCLERATGRGFADLLAEHVWTPIGAEQDFISIIDSAGTVSFEGGFNVCLRDFARFGLMIAQDGRYENRQLVPENWIHKCRHPGEHLIAAFAASEYATVAPRGGYHNQWWVRDAAHGVLMALGVHGQVLFIDPVREFVVAKFSSQPEPADVAMAIDQVLAFEAIAEALG